MEDVVEALEAPPDELCEEGRATGAGRSALVRAVTDVEKERPLAAKLIGGEDSRGSRPHDDDLSGCHGGASAGGP